MPLPMYLWRQLTDSKDRRYLLIRAYFFIFLFPVHVCVVCWCVYEGLAWVWVYVLVSLLLLWQIPWLKTTWGRKSLFGLHFQVTVHGVRARTPVGTELETMQQCGLPTSSSWLLSLLPYTAQDLPRESTTSSGLRIPHQSKINTVPHRCGHRTVLSGQSPN